jgi:hypothetical protein
MARIIPVVEVTAFLPALGANDAPDTHGETVRLELGVDGRLAFPTGMEFDARELREAVDLLLKAKNGNTAAGQTLPHVGGIAISPGHGVRNTGMPQ